jgi:hypothetical protein
MVKFAPEPTKVQTSDYTGRRPGPVDTSFGDLFKGLGDAVQNYTSMEDQLIKDDISLTAHDEVDATARGILQDTGAADATPSEILRSAEGVEKLKSAYDNGAFSEMYFTSQLDSTARRLKNRYPGYRDQIDAVIGSAAGSSMANQRRKLINQELKAQASAEDEERKFWRNWAKQEAPGLVRNFGTADPFEIAQSRGMSLQEVMDTVSKDTAYREDLTFQQNTLKPMQTDKIKQVASKSAQTFIRDNVRLTILGSGKEGDTQEVLADIMADGEVSGKEASYLETTVKPRLAQARTELQSYLLQPINENGDSFASLLPDTSDQQDVLAASMAYIDSLERAVNDKDMGALGVHGRMADARVDQKRLEIINGPGGDRLLTLNALDKMVPIETVLPALQQLDEEDATIRAISDALKGQTVTGSKSGDDAMRELQQAEAGPQVYNDLVDTWTRVLVSPDASPEAVSNVVESVYGEDSHRMLSKFTPSSRVAMYGKLTAAPVVDRIYSMGVGSQEARKLREWSYRQFSLIARPYATQLRNVGDSARHDVTWDEEAGQFTVEHKREFKDELAAFVGASDVRDATTDAITKLNEYLVNLKYIADKSGADYNEIVKQLFLGLEVDVSPLWSHLVKEVSKPKEEEKSD